MKFVVFSLGCRVNQYEGQSLIKELENRGFEATDKLEKADYYVINTCSVTGEADRKSRQTVARVLKLNPAAKVAICGCSSQNDPKPYKNKPNVTIIGGTSGKMSLIDSIMSDIVQGDFVHEPPKTYEDDLYGELTKTRGYIKVQDGCNNFCSYCIIPYLRGRSRSRALESIVKEAEEMAKKTHEIVVTGINVSDYGSDIGLTLFDLVHALSAVPVRKRFGSLECTVVNERLLEEMKNGDWCDSVHLSMQSGSDGILRRMNRKYTSEFFIEKCDLIKRYFPDAGITTDVIVGFPGETEEEFEDTIRVCKRAGFAWLHVFPYSVRKGTVAAKMKQVDPEVMAERAARLRAVSDELKTEFLKKQIGKIKEVYVEEEVDGFGAGFASDYVRVYSDAAPGTFAKQKITSLFRDGVKGETIQ